jgi:hypothetical protein
VKVLTALAHCTFCLSKIRVAVLLVLLLLLRLLLQGLVDAWAASAGGKAAAAAAAAHKHMTRTPSGEVALGSVNTGPVAGWLR